MAADGVVDWIAFSLLFADPDRNGTGVERFRLKKARHFIGLSTSP
jgi:hypothetical protein